MKQKKDTNLLSLRGVNVHNLKNVDLDLPLGKLIVFTGLSGSGKSSLAFDTIYTEGQRRYIESLSHTMRRMMGTLAKPDAQSITGMPPTIAIEQKTTSKNPRSTVGTITSIHDYLRLIYARLATAYCPISLERVTPISRGQIADEILALPPKTKCIFLSPFIKGKKGEYKDDFQKLLKKGFSRLRVDGAFVDLSEEIPSLDKNLSHDIDIVIDRIAIKKEETSRIHEAISTALDTSDGVFSLLLTEKKEERTFSEHAYSEKSGNYYPPLEPENFSFNHPLGMCPRCSGLGTTHDFDLDLIIDENLSIEEDCCKIAGHYNTVRWGNIYRNLAKIYKFKVSTPWHKLSDEAKEIFLYGNNEKWTKMYFTHPDTGKRWVDYVRYNGVIAEAKRRLSEASSDIYRNKMEALMCKTTCPECHGAKIKSYPGAARFREKTLQELSEMSLDDLFSFFESITFDEQEEIICGEVRKEILERISFLRNVGLGYLSLSRDAPSLSGGESQRVRLASQIGSGLVSTLYILDEPSIGLHPRDNRKLLNTLHLLKEKGNTVLVVEHDEETIKAADHIVDIGPGAGVQGGKILSSGTLETLLGDKDSLTGAYLRLEEKIAIPKMRRKGNGKSITLEGCRHHNLKDVNVTFPLGKFIAITGVSGSGKSSLITDTLFPLLANHHHKAKHSVGKYKKAEGLDNVDKVIAIDQTPIGRTPRSNPATYVKVFDDIRNLFASLPEAKAFGYKPGRFSFNVREGCCPHCKGMGTIRIDMDFMEDEWLECPHCKGRRFDPKTLAICYREKNIYDVLHMPISEAVEFFSEIPAIHHKVSLLDEVGLGYITLGQAATTLSGGEAQRIKLAKELMRPSSGNTFYILDEPTTGLHFHDIHKLIQILQRLVDGGNSVLVIEHNTDLIKTADYIIDIGPEGGMGGGRVISTGPPEKIAKEHSPTGEFLKPALEPKPMTADEKITLEPADFPNAIVVKGAKQNTLKDVSLTIPRGQISIFTGPSGSGKSSLAFETIYAEGQRRYVDTLSPYTKRFVSPMPKPKVDEVEGLPPPIAIEQKGRSWNPRSTLGTMTEIYDYLRLIYARLGIAYCPETNEKIVSITPEYVAEKIMKLKENTKLFILAPIQLKRSDNFTDVLARFQKNGFTRIRLDGIYYSLDDEIPYDRKKKNQLELVIDRLILKKGIMHRILEAIESAKEHGDENTLIVEAENKDLFFNLAFAVPSTGKSFPPITHHTFSFNSEEGMCPECSGIGMRFGVNLSQDPTLLKYSPADLLEKLLKNLSDSAIFKLFYAVFKAEKINPDKELRKLEKEERSIFFNGSSKVVSFQGMPMKWLGLNHIFSRIARMGKGELRESVLPIMSQTKCPACSGSRLCVLARHVEFEKKTLPNLITWPLAKVLSFLKTHKPKKELSDVFGEVLGRLSFLEEIGLGYLSLDRAASTLSGGESQRTRLANQLGSGLTGTMYVLDEPTIGLHPFDNEKLNASLKKLKARGNTLIMVEHDPLTLSIADKIYDFGPGSGIHGGHLLASGTYRSICKNTNSITGQYLSKKERLPEKKKLRDAKSHFLIENASLHNLKNINLKIPTKVFSTITGVSGSGKSTLMHGVLIPALKANIAKRTPAKKFTLEGTTFSGLEQFEKVLFLDQNPIGGTSRSDVCTYVDLLTPLRTFFASLPEAKIKGLKPGAFSFNHVSGMCKTCRGMGERFVDLHFLPPARVICEACNGSRLNPVSSAITYKGRNLGSLLSLTAREAKEIFPPIPKVEKILKILESVKLDYLPLSRATQSLSGGESVRLKLAKELIKPTRGHTLYIFDEPTTGLHFEDIKFLLPIFDKLVDKGHTLIVIEHNIDVIKHSDHIIDLGPGPGDDGGHIVFEGTVSECTQSSESKTAKFLSMEPEALLK